MSLRLGVHGAGGRMGCSVLQVALDQEGIQVSAAVDRVGGQSVGQDVGSLIGRAAQGLKVSERLDAANPVQVWIDFSTPEATSQLLRHCIETRSALVLGTTGLDAEGESLLRSLAGVAPVMRSPNMSLGVTVLCYLARQAVALLGEAFDAEIVEMHHRAKIDAPSGTALRIAEVVAEAKGWERDSFCFGREGKVGARPDREIGVLALRGGDVVGDHTLTLAGPSERVEITHRAHDRLVFARGAVRAATWVVQQTPGIYDMMDVLGVARR